MIACPTNWWDMVAEMEHAQYSTLEVPYDTSIGLEYGAPARSSA